MAKDENNLESILLRDYESYIKNLAKEDKDEVFFNSSDSHALIVLKQIVQSVNTELKIYCGNLCTNVSNDKGYLDALKDFLNKKGAKLKVLFADFSEEFYGKPIYNLFINHREKIELRSVLPNHIITKDGMPVHFTIGDLKMYRLETDIKNKKAIGNFNDVGSTGVLCKIFNRYFKDYSEEINI